MWCSSRGWFCASCITGCHDVGSSLVRVFPTGCAASPAASDGTTKILSVPIGDDYTSSIYFANTAYEAVNGNRTMNVGVSLDTTGAKSTVTLKLPNPTPNTSVYYDPTVMSTNSPGSAAGATRVTLWSLLAAVLLSLLLRA